MLQIRKLDLKIRLLKIFSFKNNRPLKNNLCLHVGIKIYTKCSSQTLSNLSMYTSRFNNSIFQCTSFIARLKTSKMYCIFKDF